MGVAYVPDSDNEFRKGTMTNEEIDIFYKRWEIPLGIESCELTRKEIFNQAKAYNTQKKLLDKLKPYLQHERKCRLILSAGGENMPCDCGLDILLGT